LVHWVNSLNLTPEWPPSRFTCVVNTSDGGFDGKTQQGVFTYVLPVEVFATGIKMESRDQCSFYEGIKTISN